jgi:NAD(P)H-dependent FMN reductase
MARFVVILGAVTKPGRLNKAMTRMCELAREAEAGVETDLINLADCKVAFADGRAPQDYGDDTASVVARVMAADAVVIATPVYRGSMTGALKNLLDQLPIEALMGKPCGIVAMGATLHHYLGAEWHLRDVLTWFGALTAPTSVYLASADFEQGEPAENARRDMKALAAAVLKMRALASNASDYLGPIPLAARKP